jgi:hypothetical protein
MIEVKPRKNALYPTQKIETQFTCNAEETSVSFTNQLLCDICI